MHTEFPAIAIVGPTAVGKTANSLLLAEKFACEIISVDSMQVYRHMDIGTAKATAEERRQIPHHLIDIVDPDEDYHAGRFVEDAAAAVALIRARGRMPLLVGGTGLYLSRLLDGICVLPQIEPAVRAEIRARFDRVSQEELHREFSRIDPGMAGKIHLHDRQRILRGLEIYHGTGETWSRHLAAQERGNSILARPLIIGLDCEREELYRRIDQRTSLIMGPDFKEEVQKLIGMGYAPSLKSMQSIGYRHMLAHLSGLWTWQQAVDLLARDTRRYAKRQLTWFRAIRELQWLPADRPGELIGEVEKYLATFRET